MEVGNTNSGSNPYLTYHNPNIPLFQYSINPIIHSPITSAPVLNLMTPGKNTPTSVVTGGAGFLGSHLCDRLLAEGHTVICIDNLITGDTSNIAHLLGRENFRFVHHDVTNYIFIDGPVA